MALDHGGAAPLVVGRTADKDALIPKVAKGGFYHSGQVCVSTQRIFVLGDDSREIASKLGGYASDLIVGNAISESTECGPLIRNREVDRVHAWVNEAVSSGAKLICGGKKISESCYAPTVLLDPPENVEVSKSEIFGPVVCVYGTKDLDVAITKSNSLPFAFQASIFSNEYSEIMSFFNKIDASAVMINEHTAFRVDWMPFAGRGQSGYGIGGIPYTMEDMTKIKMAVFTS
jgi:acyl-CoA reductase-like NAD-dependent aldehyde dehydrogenase